MSFDPTKPVQTRNGHKARILTTDLNNSYPIIAAITEPPGIEFTYAYLSDGRAHRHGNSNCDLINIPEKITHFLNLYPEGEPTESLNVFAHTTLSDALHNGTTSRLGTLEITIADGKLIDVIVHS